MDEKIEAIRAHILEGMPDRAIQYKHSGRYGLHKFRIEGGEPTPHWLYVTDQVVDDSEPTVLIDLIDNYHIVETLNQAKQSKWLYLSSNGIEEVDDNFAEEDI